MNISLRICEQCQKPLHGRTDQRFCDAYCRNAFHNRSKQPYEQYIKLVNAHIRKNRRILREICPVGKTTVRREVLEIKGFNFKYFSGTFHAHSSGQTYYLCYDYGFAAIMDNGKQKALIIQKQNYMDDYQLDPWSGVS